MKYISTILSVIALALAIFLLVRDSGHKGGVAPAPDAAGQSGKPSFRIAYFDMDSLEAHYEHFKDALAQLNTKQNAINMELASMDKKNQNQINEWRSKGNTMTQAEGEAAQQQYQKMQQDFQSREQALKQDLYKQTEESKTNIRKEVEEFLKLYNKDNKYSFIFAYDPSSFIYSKDSSYNITPELVDGLNAAYSKTKK